jgi:hypothetical protein
LIAVRHTTQLASQRRSASNSSCERRAAHNERAPNPLRDGCRWLVRGILAGAPGW